MELGENTVAGYQIGFENAFKDFAQSFPFQTPQIVTPAPVVHVDGGQGGGDTFVTTIKASGALTNPAEVRRAADESTRRASALKNERL